MSIVIFNRPEITYLEGLNNKHFLKYRTNGTTDRNIVEYLICRKGLTVICTLEKHINPWKN